MTAFDPRLNFVNVLFDIKRERAAEKARDENAMIERAVVIEERREREADDTRLRDVYGPFTAIKSNRPRGMTTEFMEVQ